MKRLFTFVFACLFSTALAAQDAPDVTTPMGEDSIILDGTDIDLDQFLWKKRPVVVFADSPNDPRFIQQMAFLNERLAELAERDVVILTDTDPGKGSALRERLRPRNFMLVVIIKDGTIQLRRPQPRDVREIIRTIDQMPMRQQEVKEQREQRANDS